LTEPSLDPARRCDDHFGWETKKGQRRYIGRAADALIVNDFHSHDPYGYETGKLRDEAHGYRACFFMLLGLMIIWGVVLIFNRTPPLHLNSCEALKYYLIALDQEASSLPAETRQLLDAQAAACPDDDRGDYDDGNPY
jgi:hypothetical protein